MRKSLFIFFFVFFSCNQTSMLEINKEYLKSQSEGEIREIEKWKGGGYLLKIKYKEQRNEIGVYKSVGEYCKKGDYFIKIKNSNKCILKRKDSLICLDCIYIENRYRDSLGQIDEWKSGEKNRWRINKVASH